MWHASVALRVARTCAIWSLQIQLRSFELLIWGLFGSSVGGEMEASSQRADIELTLPFGSSSFISCSDRSSWASSRQARLHPCNCLNRLLVRLKNVSLKNIGGDHNLNELEPPFRDASELACVQRAHLEPLLPLSAKPNRSSILHRWHSVLDAAEELH